LKQDRSPYSTHWNFEQIIFCLRISSI
jgi:hypothetical protein